MQCLDVDAMFGCLSYNVWVVLQYLDFLCKTQRFMQFSDFDAIFGCLCIVRVLMHCSHADTLFGCLCNVGRLMH